MKRFAFFSCVVAFCLVGCAGTETGNPPTKVGVATLALGIHLDEEGWPGEKPSIEAAGLGVEHLELVSCDGDSVVLIDEVHPIDLLAGSPTFSVPAGDYCELNLGMAPAALGYERARVGAPLELTLGVLLRGSANALSLEDASAGTSQILPSAESFSLEDGAQMVLAVDLGKLLGPVLDKVTDALSSVEPAAAKVLDPLTGLPLVGPLPEGTQALVVVDEEHAPEIAQELQHALPASFILFRDANGDGALASDGSEEILGSSE